MGEGVQSGRRGASQMQMQMDRSVFLSTPDITAEFKASGTASLRLRPSIKDRFITKKEEEKYHREERVGQRIKS